MTPVPHFCVELWGLPNFSLSIVVLCLVDREGSRLESIIVIVFTAVKENDSHLDRYVRAA